MDGYAWLFAFLISSMGALIVLYARYYMSRQDPLPRFFSFFLAFMGAMMGVVLSGNIIQLAIFWEITSLSRSEEHTSELQSLMRISYAVFCLKKKKINKQETQYQQAF